MRKNTTPKDPHRQQANKYDKIWRENLRSALPGLIEKVLKLNITHRIDLPDKIQITRQKEMDLLQQVTDREGHTYILHIEIQTQNEADMVYRMAEYRIMTQQVYQLPVLQYVIYLGQGKATMPSRLSAPGLYFEYTLLSLSEVPYQLFLSSDKPEEKLLAVLADFGGENPETVIGEVLQGVRTSSGGDFSENRYWQQLRILIQLRNLGDSFNKAMETVTKFFKEEKDPFYQKGKLEGKSEVVRNLLGTGRFTVSEIANFAGVSEAFVKEVAATLRKGE